jgi:cysteine desulfurase
VKSVYLDFAAATPLAKEVKSAMAPFFDKNYANPSALYAPAVKAREAVEAARACVAKTLGTNPDTVLFTSGGAEANNSAILGVARSFKNPGHIIVSSVEHETVLEPVNSLKKMGWHVTTLSVDSTGTVKPEEVINAIRPNTALVSVMYANNEIGTIEPIAEIGRHILRYRKEHSRKYPYFHSDACQAAGFLDLSVEKLHVDLLTLNGGKIYGPKGSGCLYVRRGIQLEPLVYGGTQERGVRAGTENVPGIIGFAKALELAQKNKAKYAKQMSALRDLLWKEIKKHEPKAILNGPQLDARLPNNLNVSFPGKDGETLVLYLSEQGIWCATGSACTTGNSEPSHVLRAVGMSIDQAKSSIRFSFGFGVTRAQITHTAQRIKQVLALLRT